MSEKYDLDIKRLEFIRATLREKFYPSGETNKQLLDRAIAAFKREHLLAETKPKGE